MSVNRLRLAMFALLGLLCTLPLRLWPLPLLSMLFPSWLAWLLAGAGAGAVAAFFSRPVHGWNWLWRPLLTGLRYSAIALVLTGILTPLVSALAQFFNPPPDSRTVPVVIASFSGFTVLDGLRLLQSVPLLFLIGATFTLLAGVFRNRSGREFKGVTRCSGG